MGACREDPVSLPDEWISFVLVPGAISQAVVTQKPSLTVIPGGTVTLTCSSTMGRAVTSGHYPYWFQQKSGQVPRLLIYNTNILVSGVPARFSGSLLGDKAALTIKGAQPEDEADYYCVLWYSSATQCHSDRFRWGTETKTHCPKRRSATDLALSVLRAGPAETSWGKSSLSNGTAQGAAKRKKTDSEGEGGGVSLRRCWQDSYQSPPR
uniref:Ig-like domain-containing protein n=1 Tax=Vombatus ursinus TaxID=29139 RepID=A0A4X2L5B1_VOMUR